MVIVGKYIAGTGPKYILFKLTLTQCHDHNLIQRLRQCNIKYDSRHDCE